MNAGVVYLYRFAEGEDVARKFLSSYLAHSAGLDHDLHIVLKGFPNRDSLQSARALFGGVSTSVIEVADTGYDIGSYFAAAKLVSNERLVFLNTFSEILAGGWLRYLHRALESPGIGLVGATGSWQSMNSAHEAAIALILRRALPALRSMFEPTAVQRADQARRSLASDRDIMASLRRAFLYPLYLRQYRRYPNPHIRTNAFMIRRGLFLSLRSPRFDKKSDVYRFESGRHSMTRQIKNLGLDTLVVDRSGATYRSPEWKLSSTFWINDQAGLMVSDNQTRGYETGNIERQKLLQSYAWDPPSSWNRLASVDGLLAAWERKRASRKNG